MIKSKDYNARPEIDLTGPDGNVCVLMGCAKQYAKQLDFDGKAIVEEMMKGDYEHALDVFEKYFGECVILLR